MFEGYSKVYYNGLLREVMEEKSVATLHDFFHSVKSYRTIIKVDNPVIPIMLTLNYIEPLYGDCDTLLIFLTEKDRRLFNLIRNQFGIGCEYNSANIFIHKDGELVPCKLVVEKLRRTINSEKDRIAVIFGNPSFIFFYGMEGLREYSIMLDLLPHDITLINFCQIGIADPPVDVYQKSMYDITVSIKKTYEHPNRYLFEIEHSALQNLTDRIGIMFTEGLLIKDLAIKSKDEFI